MPPRTHWMPGLQRVVRIGVEGRIDESRGVECNDGDALAGLIAHPAAISLSPLILRTHGDQTDNGRSSPTLRRATHDGYGDGDLARAAPTRPGSVVVRVIVGASVPESRNLLYDSGADPFLTRQLPVRSGSEGCRPDRKLDDEDEPGRNHRARPMTGPP